MRIFQTTAHFAKSALLMAAILLAASPECLSQKIGTKPALLRVDTVKVRPHAIAGFSEVVGEATNISNKTIDEAFIKFNLFDRDNALVGNSIVNVRNIEAGGKWKFKVTAAVKATSVKVIEVSAFD